MMRLMEMIGRKDMAGNKSREEPREGETKGS